MNFKSIKHFFTGNQYQALGAEDQPPPTANKPLTHKQEKHAAVLYRKDTNGNKVASLDCLPHVIRFLEHEKIPTGRILKLRTDILGNAYLSRDKYRQQRSSVMGIPVDPGNGQRDAANYFTQLVIEAHALDGLSEAGKKAVEKLNALTNGIAVLDTASLLKHLRTLHQAIQELQSGTEGGESEPVDHSGQTIETYTARNDPRTRLTESVSGDGKLIDMSPGSQPDRPPSDQSDTVDAFVSRLPVSPVVLPPGIVNQMNAIFDQAARAKGNDGYQVRLDMDTDVPEKASATSEKHGFFSKKT